MSLFILSLTILLGTEGAARRTDGYQIQGSWKVQSAVEDGREAPASREASVRLIFRDGVVAINEDRESVKATYRLDPTRSPKRIDAIPASGPHKGKVLIGIYQINGDSLQLCLPIKPGQDVPNDFSSRPGSGWVSLTLLRDKSIAPIK